MQIVIFGMTDSSFAVFVNAGREHLLSKSTPVLDWEKRRGISARPDYCTASPDTGDHVHSSVIATKKGAESVRCETKPMLWTATSGLGLLHVVW